MNPTQRTTDWHHRPVEEVATLLKTALDIGLSDDDAAARRALNGENRIAPKPGKGSVATL